MTRLLELVEGLRDLDVRKATIAWAEWIAEEWQLDLKDVDDRAFLRIEADLFNAILMEMRDGKPLRWEYVVEMTRKMWTALRIERAKRGRVTADESLDVFIVALAAQWREFVDVWRSLPPDTTTVPVP